MSTRARLALLTACFLWALSFIATKVALEAVPPLTVVSLRLSISALCFLPWLVVAGGWLRKGGWGLVAKLFGLSLFGTSLHYGLQTAGLQFTTASNASLYAITGPITILILSAILLGERITTRKAVGVAIAIVGVLVVMGLETITRLEFDSHVLGDFLVLVSIAMWGLFTVFGKKLTDELGALRVTAVVTLIGALTIAPAGWLEMRAKGFSLTQVSGEAWFAITFLGVACSFLATLLYFIALGLSESQKVGVYLYTIPPMTAVFAALYLGETVTAGLIIGSILVISGVALTERG
jgi:drug/metabolite transporter (DMT)-like permease